jgi:hypothetical protein
MNDREGRKSRAYEAGEALETRCSGIFGEKTGDLQRLAKFENARTAPEKTVVPITPTQIPPEDRRQHSRVLLLSSDAADKN